jgi:hypothetical protein
MPRTNPQRYSDPLRGTRTKPETARMLGCSPVQVDKLMEKQVLDYVEIGNRKLPTVASIEKLLGRPIAELEAPLRDAASAPPAVETPPAVEPPSAHPVRARPKHRGTPAPPAI